MAIRSLHNQYTLPGVSFAQRLVLSIFLCFHVFIVLQYIIFQGLGPIQVRYADGERERLGSLRLDSFRIFRNFYENFSFAHGKKCMLGHISFGFL